MRRVLQNWVCNSSGSKPSSDQAGEAEDFRSQALKPGRKLFFLHFQDKLTNPDITGFCCFLVFFEGALFWGVVFKRGKTSRPSESLRHIPSWKPLRSIPSLEGPRGRICSRGFTSWPGRSDPESSPRGFSGGEASHPAAEAS